MAQSKELPESLREISVNQLLEGDESSGITEDDEDIVGEPENDADEFANLSDVLVKIGDTDSEAKVMIHRMPSNGEKNSAFVAEYTVSHFATLGLPYMQKRFGAGEYQLRVYGKRPAKRRDGSAYKKTVLLKRQQVTIEKTFEVESAPQQSGNADMPMFAAILAKMDEGNRQSQALMMEGFRQMMSVQSLNPQPSRMSMLEEMKVMRDLFAPTGAPLAAVPVIDPMDQVSKVLALTQQLKDAVGGGAPQETSLMDLGKELVGLVASGALSTPQPQPQQRAPRIAPPQALPQPAPPAQQPGGMANVTGRVKFHEAAGWVNGAPDSSTQENTGVPDVKLAQALRRVALPNRLDDATISRYIGNAAGMLEKAADNGSDPAAYAVTICDMLGDDIVERVLERPEWRQEILTANPGMQAHAAWLDQLSEELTYILHGEPEGDNTGGPLQGTSDVSSFDGNNNNA